MIINIYWVYHKNNLVTAYINSFGLSIGEISTFFIANKIKYESISIKKKYKHTKRSWKTYLILFIINIFYSLPDVMLIIIDYLINDENDYNKDLCVLDGMEIIFLTLFSYYLLKYQYYLHHFISISIFVILTIIIDILLKNYVHINIFILIRSIIYIISESIIFSFAKYLIEYKFFSFIDILFAVGIYDFIIYFFSFVITIINDVNSINNIYFVFNNFYIENGVWRMLEIFLYGFILGFFVHTLGLATVNELTPNHIIIGYVLSKMPLSFLLNEGIIRWLILVISIFQIIILMFYLEIFEFNFCSLNKNTRKNIIIRMQNKNFEDKDNEIDIKGYDISESIIKQEKELELKQIIE